jgi:hypothetical protein
MSASGRKQTRPKCLPSCKFEGHKSDSGRGVSLGIELSLVDSLIAPTSPASTCSHRFAGAFLGVSVTHLIRVPQARVKDCKENAHRVEADLSPAEGFELTRTN